MKAIIKQVPTTIVTGFLGTGKTSTIQQLLKHKPDDERWAILVNEFGSIGIDGTLYQNTHEKQGGVFVREVPGGCMCCISGLPMQIALNVLLKLSNPHRLLIEPSGLGHPKEVVALLKSKYYKDVLDIQKIITLIDPHQFLQSKYLNHETYRQQLTIADVVVINKIDRCDQDQLNIIKTQLIQRDDKFQTCCFAKYGKVDPSILMGETSCEIQDEVIMRVSDKQNEELPKESPIPTQTGFVKSQRFSDGYYGLSWRFDNGYVFSKDRLLKWISSIKAERVKGVFNTDSGVIGFNAQGKHVETISFDSFSESRIEIITPLIDSSWDKSLANCVNKRTPLTTELTSFTPVITDDVR